MKWSHKHACQYIWLISHACIYYAFSVLQGETLEEMKALWSLSLAGSDEVLPRALSSTAFCNYFENSQGTESRKLSSKFTYESPNLDIYMLLFRSNLHSQIPRLCQLLSSLSSTFLPLIRKLLHDPVFHTPVVLHRIVISTFFFGKAYLAISSYFYAKLHISIPRF